MSGLDHTHVLLATLGGQPQVITFTLDLLLQRNIPISEVNIVHPAAKPDSSMGRSVERLVEEFPGDRYKVDGRIIHLRRHVLRYYGQPLDDIVDETCADGALNTMFELIRSLKQRQCIVHFSITGGRRLVSFLSISAAILSFDHADRIWHIYTPEAVQQRVRGGEYMHALPQDGIRLIEVPLARLSQTLLSQLLDTHTSARELIYSQTELAEAEERARCKQVVDTATPRQREVLEAFARGLHPREVAKHLSIDMTTVSSHTSVLLRLSRNAWNINDNERHDYRFLQTKFAKYFNNHRDSIPYTM
jgi:CRISPR-associated protein Csx14